MVGFPRPPSVTKTVSLLRPFWTYLFLNHSLTDTHSTSCASCENQDSVVSGSKSDSFATEEYQSRLDAFVEAPLQCDPFSARPVSDARLGPSSLFLHNFDLWLYRFFPYLNRPRRHVLAFWNEGHNVAGPFRGTPQSWLVGTYTEDIQFELIGIGTQFGDY
ncbi:unnamed protein product [Fusarium graminearum]|nr:hypothetical protein FG05_11753 [Fusarium graminearum]CAF3575923.1 unnamed protein product [Fusarium graminearum]CAF3603188.1 unnamed protein product [Fusarium graminearum]CAG2002400.1 unnamed protein product [Fusarium graminearum]CAG2003047.1 unnamed protein product [Fusarium graminearum]